MENLHKILGYILLIRIIFDTLFTFSCGRCLSIIHKLCQVVPKKTKLKVIISQKIYNYSYRECNY